MKKSSLFTFSKVGATRRPVVSSKMLAASTRRYGNMPYICHFGNLRETCLSNCFLYGVLCGRIEHLSPKESRVTRHCVTVAKKQGLS